MLKYCQVETDRKKYEVGPRPMGVRLISEAQATTTTLLENRHNSSTLRCLEEHIMSV